MAWGRHVGVDSTVGSVRSSPSLLGLVHLDVRNEQRVHVKSLDLGVALGVSQQVQQDLNALLRPPSLSVGGSFVLCLRGSSDTAAEPPEHDHALVVEDVLQVLFSLVQTHSLDSHGGLASVLEVNAQVAPASLINKQNKNKNKQILGLAFVLQKQCSEGGVWVWLPQVLVDAQRSAHNLSLLSSSMERRRLKET